MFTVAFLFRRLLAVELGKFAVLRSPLSQHVHVTDRPLRRVDTRIGGFSEPEKCLLVVLRYFARASLVINEPDSGLGHRIAGSGGHEVTVESRSLQIEH